MPIRSVLSISPEVADALAQGRAVVALESTIITHGMPYPQNLQMAGEVEAIVRAAGAVPATIALMGGRIRVGLTAPDLEQLAETGMAAAKASRRDVAALLTAQATAGTTVAMEACSGAHHWARRCQDYGLTPRLMRWPTQ